MAEIYKNKKIFGNVICKEILHTKNCHKITFKLFNIKIAEKIIKDDIVRYYFLGIPTKNVNLPELFYKSYLKDIKFDYDDVYILKSNSGEVFLFLAYCAKALLNKNNSKNPLFIATKKYHIDLVKMYFPNANILYFDKNNFRPRVKSDKFIVKNHHCYIICTDEHCDEVELDAIREEVGKVHYFERINEFLGLTSNENTKPEIYISDDIEHSLNEKIKQLNLDINNFVIIAPEARTCVELPISFWQKVTSELKHRGFDIFLNITNQNNHIEGCKYVFLDYRELFSLAEKSKAVISLRSGMTEFLSQAEVPNITVYKLFRNRYNFSVSADKATAAFTMHKFPFVNHDLICELNFDNYKDENSLLAEIFKNFDNMVTKERQ